MNIECAECGCTFEVEDMSEPVECPECSFSAEKCTHPQSYRDEQEIYSVDEGKHVRRVICSKCGTPL